MISFVGYNFLSDLNSVDPYPTNVGIFNQVEIYRAIYDHIDISNDTTITSNIPPTQWDFGTILDCNFNGNISGGTIKDFSSGITQVRVKKRKVGEFDWQIIKTYDISSSEDLSFVFNDYLTATNTEYEYAYVPVFGSVEGQYAISTVMSQFDGVFICDANTIFKFNMGVEYGSTDTVQQVGTFTVLGRKYPIVMSNGLANYQTGQLSGLVLPEAGTEKKEASPGVGLPPVVITKVSIVSQNGKSGFPILTFRESLRAWKNAADGPDFADFPFAVTRLALHLQRAGAHRAAPARRLFGVDCLPHTVKASARRARQAC